MLWGSPLALIGLAAVAIPLLVHLLATTRAPRVPFPTLRFLPRSTPVSVRARRFSDRWLLLLRCLTVALAALALAQPWLDRRRDASGGDTAPRVVVVDASASMERLRPTGESGLELARRRAEEIVVGASQGTIIEAAELDAGINAASAWLARVAPGGAGEVVVVSDFQRGALTATEVSTLSDAAGLRLVSVPADAVPQIEMPPLQTAEQGWSTTVSAAPTATTATWSPHPAEPSEARIEWLAAEGSAAAAAAVAAAVARVVAVSPETSAHRITVVWPDAAERAALRQQVAPPSSPWMADVLAALPSTSRLQAGSRDGRLYLFVEAAPGSMASARILASLRAAASPPSDREELEPDGIDDGLLRSWERPIPPTREPPANDGRWLWLLTSGLLIIEQVVRRETARVAPADSTPDAQAGGPDHVD